MKFLNQNRDLIVVVAISILISILFPFIYGLAPYEINLYERLAPLITNLLGLIIASYAIFVGFISQLKSKVGDKEVISALNVYFLIIIFILIIANVVNVIHPIFSYNDSIITRFIYVFSIGSTILLVIYTFYCAKTLVKD